MITLSVADLNILTSRHANSYESAQLRDKLIQAGQHFCSTCKTVKSPEDFPVSIRGRGGRCSKCYVCGRRKSKVSYIHHGLRSAENTERFCKENPEARKAATQRFYDKQMRSDAPRPPPQTPEAKAASKRRNFDRRKALGMSGRQANYVAPAPEFDESWNAIKR